MGDPILNSMQLARLNLAAATGDANIIWKILSGFGDSYGVKPYSYLQDILTRLGAGHPVNRIDELLPWNWANKLADGSAASR